MQFPHQQHSKPVDSHSHSVLSQTTACTLHSLSNGSLACRMPEAATALAGRLESVLELLGQLLATFRPPANALLPVLRVAGQTLTLQGLQLLQMKATGETAGRRLAAWPGLFIFVSYHRLHCTPLRLPWDLCSQATGCLKSAYSLHLLSSTGAVCGSKCAETVRPCSS